MPNGPFSPTNWIKTTTGSLIAACCVLASCAQIEANRVDAENLPSTSEPRAPNIVLMIADDHAFQAISAYGSDLISTPNIDALADHGVLFHKAYVANSICSPSRASIITGKYSHSNGLRNNLQVFDGSQLTLPKILKDAGYETAVIGKWHLKSEPTGFDFWKVLPGQGQYYNPDFRTPMGTVRESGYVTDVITDISEDWLRQRQSPEQPFFLMYSHKAPHREWLPRIDDASVYIEKQFPEPATLFSDYSGNGTAAKEAEMRILEHMGLSHDNKITLENAEEVGYEQFEEWFTWAYNTPLFEYMTPSQRERWLEVYRKVNQDFMETRPEGRSLLKWKYQRYMQDYLAVVKALDDNVGRMVSVLEDVGELDNTIIVYMSDQGFYLGENGWYDKRFMYEPSFRTPLIVADFRTEASAKDEWGIVQNVDVAPTLLEASGIDIPEEMQGRSFFRSLKFGEPIDRKFAYYHYYEFPGIHAVKRHYGISDGRYKLIHFYYDVDEWEFYDLKVDPLELTNVFDDPNYKSIIAEMMVELKTYREEIGDTDDLRSKQLSEDLAKIEEVSSE